MENLGHEPIKLLFRMKALNLVNSLLEIVYYSTTLCDHHDIIRFIRFASRFELGVMK
jgi:hypothetical protein